MAVEEINACIQKKLSESGMEKVSVVDAAQWLDEAGLVKDNPNRPGNALRYYLQNDIQGAKKEKNRWFIYRVEAEKSKPSRKVKAKETGSIENLEQCYDLVNNPQSLQKVLDSDPLSLIKQTRDLTRVSIMSLAKSSVEGYSDKANMTDTISLLYEKRLIGKIAVQCLHVIRKLGNLAIHEREQLGENNDRLIAGMVGNAFIIFYDEAKRNNLI